MNERQTVHEYRYIVAVIVSSTIRHILVYDLQVVVVDIGFINDGDVGCRAVLTDNRLSVVLLNCARLLNYAVVGIAEVFGKERFPFIVGELDVVEPFNMTAEISYEVGLRGDIYTLVSLTLKLTYKVSFPLSFL